MLQKTLKKKKKNWAKLQKTYFFLQTYKPKYFEMMQTLKLYPV